MAAAVSNPRVADAADTRAMPSGDRPVTPVTLVIVGASGDLTRRLLFPAVHRLIALGRIPVSTRIVGYAIDDWSTAAFLDHLRQGVADFGDGVDETAWAAISANTTYVAGDLDASKMAGLVPLVTGPAVIYLALPPALFGPAASALGACGLADESSGWRRLVIEKPFGIDSASAVALQTELTMQWNEGQLYRIDHFLGKDSAGGFQYATAGVGTMGHMLGEHFFTQQGVKPIHIGYKGAAPALQDLIGGQVKVLIDAYIPTGVQVAGGRARGIALATSKRSPVLPDVPTFAESGFPGLEAFGFYGVAAPAGTPKPLVNQLNAAFVAAANDRKVRASLVASGYEVMASSPAEYRAFVKNQIDLWTPVVKQSNIKVEQ